MLKSCKKTMAVLMTVLLMAALPALAAQTVLVPTLSFDGLEYTSSGHLYGTVLPAAYPEAAFTGYGQITWSLEEGLFGKGAGDLALKYYAMPLSAQTMTGFRNSSITATTFENGDSLVYSWQYAFGTGNARPFALEVETTTYTKAALINVNTSGAITIAGSNRGTIPNYSAARWYDFKAVFTFTAGAPTVALYVDGVNYGGDISFGSGTATGFTILNLCPMHTTLANSGSGTNCHVYIDNVKGVKYESETPAGMALNLTSSSPATVETKPNGTVVFRGTMTPAQIISALGISGLTAGDDYTLSLLDSSFTSQTGNAVDGHLKITLKDGGTIYRSVEKFNSVRPLLSADMSVDAAPPAAFNTSYPGVNMTLSGGSGTSEYRVGLFGKAATDAALYLVRSGAQHQYYYSNSGVTSAIFEDSDILVYNWQGAFNKVSSIYLDAVLSDGTNTTYSGTPPTSNDYTPSLLVVSQAGGVTLGGVSGGTIPDYMPGRWYDYKIVVEFSDTNAPTASLYVDGVAYGRDVSLGSDPAIKFTSFRFCPGNARGQYRQVPGTDATDVYIDNISAVQYIGGDGAPTAFDLSITATDLRITTLNQGLFVTEEGVSVTDFYNGFTTTGVPVDSCTLLDNNFEEQTGTVKTAPGYLKIVLADGSTVFRNVRVSLLIDERFSATYPTSGSRPVNSSVISTNLASLAGKESDDYAVALVRTNSADQYFEAPSPVDLNGIWTYEFSICQDVNLNPKFGVRDGASTWSGTWSLGWAIPLGQWTKLALEVNCEEDTIKLYQNGSFVEINTAVLEDRGVDKISLARITCVFSAFNSDGTQHALALDNFKLYAGTYKNAASDLITVAANSGDVIVSGSAIDISKTMTKSEFLSALNISGAVKTKIFDNSSYALTEKADIQNTVEAGQYLVLYSADDEVIKYYLITELFSATPISFVVLPNEDICATTTVKSSDPARADARLIIAAYKGDQLCYLGMDSSTLSSVPVTLSASIDIEGDTDVTIKAFLWNITGGRMTNLSNVCPYALPAD